MRVKICTWNVRSMADNDRRNKILLSLNTVGGDINLLQETWMNDSLSQMNRGWRGPNIWSDYLFHAHRKAGVAILCKRWIGNLQPEFSCIIPGRAVCITITSYCGTRINIICYYASCNLSVEDRMSELRSLNSKLPGFTIIGGDFNSSDDPINPTKKQDHALEKWSQVNNLVDSWAHLYQNDPGFTYSNGKTQRRLDRFIISSNTTGWVKQMKVFNYKLSDHFPVTISIDTAVGKPRMLGKISNYILQSEEISKKVEEIVSTYNPSTISPIEWLKIKDDILSFLYKESKELRKKSGKKIRYLEMQIKKISKLPNNPTNEAKLIFLREEINRIYEERIQKSLLSSRKRNFLYGQKVNKYFLNWNKPVINCPGPTCLEENGQITKDPEEISAICSNFYQNLWKNESVNSEKLQEILQKNNGKKLSPSAQNLLNKEISAEEILTVTKKLKPNKACGPDKLGSEIYQKYQVILAPILIRIFNLIIRLQSIPQGFASALISLIYKKKGNKNDIRNWRPISVMNTDYKIFGSILRDRLQTCLHQLIEPEQSGFVKGRSISSNIWTMKSIMQLSNLNMIDGSCILLDQEKAYDRVEHAALTAIMKARDFPTDWINVIESIHQSATCVIKSQSCRPITIQRSRGVFQGCPLAPLLYNIVVDLLASEIKRKINGINLQGAASINLKCLQYADDTVVFLSGQTDENNLMDALKSFSSATGGKINTNKSEGFNLSDNVLHDTRTDFVWNPKGSYFEYLGIPFGDEQSTFWNRLIEKINKTATMWNKSLISLAGKVTVCNTLLLSKVTYVMRHCEVPSQIMMSLKQIINNFVCTPRTKYKLRQLHQLPENGGFNLINLETSNTILTLRWWNELISDPLGLWQRVTWECIHNIHGDVIKFLTYCKDENFGNRLVDSIFKPRIILLVSNFSLEPPPIGVNRLFTSNGIDILITNRDYENGYMTYPIGFSINGEHKRDPRLHAKVAPILQPTSVTTIRGGKWVTRPDTLQGYPSPHRIIRTDGKMKLSCMFISKIKQLFIFEPTLRNTSMENWKKDLNESPPLECAWAQANQKIISPSHKSLMLQLAARNLWIGDRAYGTSKNYWLCPLCNNSPESLTHLFWFCSTSQIIWKTASKILGIQNFNIKTALFGALISNERTNMQSLALIRGHVCNLLWRTRCNALNENAKTHSPPAEILEKIFLKSVLNQIEILHTLENFISNPLQIALETLKNNIDSVLNTEL